MVFRVKDASNVLQDRFNIERDGAATFSSSVTATNAVFTNDGSSRVMYLRGSGNIIQFQDGNSANKWEVVGREGTFYIYKNDV